MNLKKQEILCEFSANSIDNNRFFLFITKRVSYRYPRANYDFEFNTNNFSFTYYYFIISRYLHSIRSTDNELFENSLDRMKKYILKTNFSKIISKNKTTKSSKLVNDYSKSGVFKDYRRWESQ